MSKSTGLSERLKKFADDGRHLNDDSCVSEGTLSAAICELIPYTTTLFASIGATIEHKKTISLYECQEYFHKVGGPPPNSDNKKVCMKPDGGVFIMLHNGKRTPILIIEDKVQGTNDILHAESKKRQATGNAIERGAKNIRGAEMLFADLDIFPYVMFASGCDFHSSETIAKRIEMMNMGMPNHYIDVTPERTPEDIASALLAVKESVSIKKLCGKSIATVFVKAHKWDSMPHGASSWKKAEIVDLCKKVIDDVFKSVSSKLST